MPVEFRFTVNLSDVSRKLNQAAEIVKNDVNDAVKKLSASTHAFVVKHGQDTLKGYALDKWLEKKPGSSTLQNVRWTPIAENMYVVEIDPAIKWIEEGRPETSMATEQWLLKGPVVPRGKRGVHQSKSGSKYRAIPMTQAKGSGSVKPHFEQTPALAAIVKQALKDNHLSLRSIERNQDGSPKIGILHKIDMKDYEPSRSIAGFHSRPRTPAESMMSGLKPHEGHFLLGGMAVIQRPEPKAKGGVAREAVTFRTVSTKHQSEGRWMAPAVQPLNSIPQAYEYAKREWENILKELEEKFRS
jgi:hypothetical protein